MSKMSRSLLVASVITNFVGSMKASDYMEELCRKDLKILIYIVLRVISTKYKP
jgi:hypothetical protein